MVKITFKQLKSICQFKHLGIEDGIASDTCRNKDNIPKGESWGKCNEKVCPVCKKVKED